MKRAWLVDLISASIMGLIVGAFVLLTGGPGWAAFGFAMLTYLTRDERYQKIERAKAERR